MPFLKNSLQGWSGLGVAQLEAEIKLRDLTSLVNGILNCVQPLKFFPPPLYFAPSRKGFPLEFCIGAGGQKTRMTGLPDREGSLTISSATWIQYTNVSNRQTNEQTPGDSKDRAYA